VLVMKNSAGIAASLTLLGKKIVKTFCIYSHYFFVPKKSLVFALVFDIKCLIASNLLKSINIDIWSIINQSKYDATITVRNVFLQGLSTKLSTGFVDNRESDYTTIS